MTSNFQFLIDWNNDGDFDDSNEDISAYVMDANWSIGFDEPYQHVAGETRLNLRLRNEDKRFSPEYSSSPMAGSILPQRQIQVQYVDGGTTVLYNGYIQHINPTAGTARDQTVHISANGIKQFLERQEYYSPFWENVTADEVINDIVSNIQLPAEFNNVLYIDVPGQNLIDTHWITDQTVFIEAETGKTTFPYVGDTWEDGVTAMQAINDLVQSERGWFFQDRSGSVTFWNRLHLMTNDTLQGTVNNTWSELEYRYSIDDIRNIFRVASYPRSLSAGSAEIIWSLSEDKTIAPDETKQFRARYSEQDSDSKVAGRNVQTPSVGGSTLVINPVGAGHQVTMDDKATSATISIENQSSSDITVTDLLIKGQKVTTYNDEEYEAVDNASVGLYGRHVEKIDHKLINDPAFAEAVANYELVQRKDARGVVRSIEVNQRQSDFVINRTVGDWIRVIDGQTDHDENYIIMGERHSWRVGDLHRVTYTLQSTSTVEFIIIDESGKNEIDSGRYIAI